MMKKGDQGFTSSTEPTPEWLIESEPPAPEPEVAADTRGNWQRTKEGWYDKVPLTVRQLDIVIGVGVVALIVIVLLIARDAGVFG